MRWLQIGSIASFVVGAIVCAVVAQTGEPLPVIPKEPVKPLDRPTPMVEPLKPTDPGDPTVPGLELKKAMEKNAKTTTTAKMPQVGLKGRVIVKDRPPVAILDVDGKLYYVAKDSVIAGAGNMTVRVIDVTRTEVKYEISPAHEVNTLR